MIHVKYLVNWTQEDEVAGGSETRHAYLAAVFPEAQRVSVRSLTGKTVEELGIRRSRIAVDNFLCDHTTKYDVVIKDLGVGGLIPLQARVVALCGNPYTSLVKALPGSSSVPYWRQLMEAQVQDAYNADVLIANSAFSRQDLEEQGIKVHHTLHNCVDARYYTPDDSPTAERELVLWVGSWSPVKARHVAFQIIRIADLLGKALFIDKLDGLSREQLRGLYRHTKVLLVSSVVEGNSNVALEAMSCGARLLTTHTGLFWEREPIGAGFRFNDHPAKQLLDLYHAPSSAYDPRGFVERNDLDFDTWARCMRTVVS